MASKKPDTIHYRRKRSGKTDYRKRLKLLLSGKSRLVVRTTNQKIIAQIIQFTEKGDRVLAAVDSFGLKKLGWAYSCRNIPAAYLTGLLIGNQAKQKNLSDVVLDTGLLAPLKKGRLFAFLKGVVDGGLQLPVGSSDIFPSDNRLKGQHIAEYLKSSNHPEKMPSVFEDVQRKIKGKGK